MTVVTSTKLVVMVFVGDSAGGNLATSVDGVLAKEHLKLSGAILIYPCTQLATTGLSSQYEGESKQVDEQIVQVPKQLISTNSITWAQFWMIIKVKLQPVKEIFCLLHFSRLCC